MSTADTAQSPPPVAPAVLDQHRWLARLVGEWRCEFEEKGGALTDCGTERVRAVGDVWIVAEGEMPMPDGSPGSTMMTLGYDPARGRFVGTWVGSMLAHLWVYDGALDDDGRVLTLAAEGPSMRGDGAIVSYRDVIELRDDDHRVLTSHVRGDDGTWAQFMTMHYRRVR